MSLSFGKSVTTLALALILTPCLATAATKKKAADTDATAAAPASTGGDTLLSVGSSSGSMPAAIHNHVSVFGAYDFTDSIDVEGKGNMDTDRAMLLGAEYETTQISHGVAVQVGGTYDFSRGVNNSNGLEIQEWTGFAELTAKMTQEFKLMGGLNYDFPSLTGAQAGADVKGKVGFQFGGSFAFAQNFAVDARYRQLGYDFRGANGSSTSATASGFVLGGRYIF
jgi:hypothetical protein